MINPTFQHERVQGQVVQDEKEFIFHKPIQRYERQRKLFKIESKIAKEHFPQRGPEDGSYNGVWFRRLKFTDEPGKVWFFDYKYWKDTGYLFHGKEWESYMEGEKVKEGDYLSFWKYRGERDHFFIRRLPAPAAHDGGKERCSKSRCLASTSKGQDQPERPMTLLNPSFTGPQPHVPRPGLLTVQQGSENMAHVDSLVDGENFATVDNSCTPSRTLLPREGNFVPAPICKSTSTMPPHDINVTRVHPTLASSSVGQDFTAEDYEEFFNFSDFEGLQNILHPTSEGNFVNGNPSADDNVIIEAEHFSDGTVGRTGFPNNDNPSNHDELLILRYYKEYQVQDPGLESQLKSRHYDKYAQDFVAKQVGTVMKILRSTPLEMEKHMQPLRDLDLNLPVLERLVASAYKPTPFEEGEVHIAKKTRRS